MRADRFPTDPDGQASSDNRRKIRLAAFALKWKKQAVKLYAVAKWARDAHIVQKCMVRVFVDFLARLERLTRQYRTSLLFC
jgi:hypothetical protein